MKKRPYSLVETERAAKYEGAGMIEFLTWWKKTDQIGAMLKASEPTAERMSKYLAERLLYNLDELVSKIDDCQMFHEQVYRWLVLNNFAVEHSKTSIFQKKAFLRDRSTIVLINFIYQFEHMLKASTKSYEDRRRLIEYDRSEKLLNFDRDKAREFTNRAEYVALFEGHLNYLKDTIRDFEEISVPRALQREIDMNIVLCTEMEINRLKKDTLPIKRKAIFEELWVDSLYYAIGCIPNVFTEFKNIVRQYEDDNETVD